MSTPTMTEPPTSKYPLLPRKKKDDRGFLDLVTFGEVRQYPIKDIEKIMRDIKI